MDIRRPPLDASQDFKLLNASESGGWTRISFQRKPDTGDTKDVKITVSSETHTAPYTTLITSAFINAAANAVASELQLLSIYREHILVAPAAFVT